MLSLRNTQFVEKAKPAKVFQMHNRKKRVISNTNKTALFVSLYFYIIKSTKDGVGFLFLWLLLLTAEFYQPLEVLLVCLLV